MCEVRQLVERVNGVRGPRETFVDVAVGPGDHRPFTGLDQSAVVAQQFLGTAPFGVLVVPLDLECLESTLGIGERLGDHRHTFLNRNDCLHAWLGERSVIVD